MFYYDFVDDLEDSEPRYYPWSKWHCRTWNARNPDHPLHELNMWLVSIEASLPGSQEPLVKKMVWSQSCDAEYVAT